MPKEPLFPGRMDEEDMENIRRDGDRAAGRLDARSKRHKRCKRMRSAVAEGIWILLLGW